MEDSGHLFVRRLGQLLSRVPVLSLGFVKARGPLLAFPEWTAWALYWLWGSGSQLPWFVLLDLNPASLGDIFVKGQLGSVRGSDEDREEVPRWGSPGSGTW